MTRPADYLTRQRHWEADAVARIEADINRSADTHLIPMEMPTFPGISVYFKDESSHPSGSLKHRLARSLFLYALINGWLRAGRPVIEASSGSTAVSEAYFARLLGLPFIAVIPASTSPEKIAAITFQGGQCHLVTRANDLHAAAQALAKETGGHFMDQFTYAERATDWRANNNIAESIFRQMELEPHALPTWIVCSAGTGGTAATCGRYVRYRRYPTRVLCADPEFSVFYDRYVEAREGIADPDRKSEKGSRIEGIGRPSMEPSFIPGCVDAMVKVPDALSLAAMHHVSAMLGRPVGGSTGTNFVGVLTAAQHMRAQAREGAIVTLLCDSGARYVQSYYDDDWYVRNGIDLELGRSQLAQLLDGHVVPTLRHSGVDGR